MQMMHVTDWLPTIVNLAQGKITKEIDGFDQWKTLQGDVESPRKEILLNVDNLAFRQEGLISGEWKIIIDSESGRKFSILIFVFPVKASVREGGVKIRIEYLQVIRITFLHLERLSKGCEIHQKAILSPGGRQF